MCYIQRALTRFEIVNISILINMLKFVGAQMLPEILVGGRIQCISKQTATASSLPASSKILRNCWPPPKCNKASRTCLLRRETVRERLVRPRTATARELGFTAPKASEATPTWEEETAGHRPTEATPTHGLGDGSSPAEGGRTTGGEALAAAGEAADTSRVLWLPACTYAYFFPYVKKNL